MIFRPYVYLKVAKKPNVAKTLSAINRKSKSPAPNAQGTQPQGNQNQPPMFPNQQPQGQGSQGAKRQPTGGQVFHEERPPYQ